MRREVDAVRSAVRISLGVKDDESLNRSWVAINEMMCSRFNAAFEKRTGTPKRARCGTHLHSAKLAGVRRQERDTSTTPWRAFMRRRSQRSLPS